MPHFSFNVVDSKASTYDPISMDLATEEEAREEAITVLVGLAKDALPDGDTRDFTARVSSEGGDAIFEASLSFRSKWLGNRG